MVEEESAECGGEEAGCQGEELVDAQLGGGGALLGGEGSGLLEFFWKRGLEFGWGGGFVGGFVFFEDGIRGATGTRGG